MTTRGAAVTAAPRPGENMIYAETWQAALDAAWRLVDENGFRYRVARHRPGLWYVTRAGRRGKARV